MKKSLVVVLAIASALNTLPSVAENYIKTDSNLNNIEELRATCVDFDLNKVYQAMQDKKQICVKNPFTEDDIVPISFKYEDENLLKPSDFDNIMPVYKKYLDFVNNDQKMASNDVMVTEIMLSNGKAFKFFKYVYDSNANINFKRSFSGKSMEKDADDFLFFHELMHLSPRHNAKNMSDNKIKMNEIEATADFASTLLISIKHNYNLDYVVELIKDVENARRKPFDKKTVVVEHYSRQSFKNIKQNLESGNLTEELNELRNLDFQKDFSKIIKRIEEIAFNSQKLSNKDYKKQKQNQK